MADSERFQRGAELRALLMGEEFASQVNSTVYADPATQKFLEVTNEVLFGTLDALIGHCDPDQCYVDPPKPPPGGGPG